MYDMSVTAAVFQPDMSSLKAVAPWNWNMYAMVATAAVFQPEMF